MMYTSVSEIKEFRECQRKWAFSGRNSMYLRPIEINNAFKVGGAFHDVLESLYKGMDYNIEEIFDKHLVADDDKDMIRFQVEKYKDNVLKHDLQRLNIIAPELSYKINITDDIILFGYIDVVYEEKKTGNIGILEHKFVRNFRSDVYNRLDEQVKAYEYAIRGIYGQCDAGVNLNQVRKLKTKFDHARETYKQTDEQLAHFYGELKDTVTTMKLYKDNGVVDYVATPSWIGCGFCDYKDLCLKLNDNGTNNIMIITEEDIKDAGLKNNKK